MADDQTRATLNQLYWETDASVGEISDRLDVSRRALYDGIEPLAAGVACSECGAPLGFRNRTARDNLEAECAACGAAVELAPVAIDPEPEVEQERAAARLSPIRSVPVRGSGPALGLMLLVGLATGAVLAFFARR